MKLTQRVYQRNFVVRIMAIASLLGLIMMAPFCIRLIPDIPSLFRNLISARDVAAGILYGMYLWSALGYLMLAANTWMLFTARDEYGLKKHLMTLMYISLIPVAALAIATLTPVILLFGVINVLVQRWIISKVIA